MNIGIIGSGNMGASMGKIWAAKGHKVLFSFSKDQEKLRAVAAAAGPNACTGTPAGAVAFGELILFSVPWIAVPEALKAAGAFQGKTLFSCVNCLKPDFSGLEVGTSTSAAEEIVKRAPGAKMVEAIPPMAQILAADSRRLDRQQISVFYCGNDLVAKASVASLLRDLDLDPVDAGPLTSARYIEPAGMLCVQLAYGMGMGAKLGMKLLRG
ncbi:MAG: NAD(P)-binding domain-containing protein [Pseudomonadota bacterium]|nr:NAD(P)-binding domain-containing protein [Pseudomonadota bacterium]